MARIKPIGRLRLSDMINDFSQYVGLPDGLVQLPKPDRLKIAGRKMPIPKDLKEFTDNICYGQRIFMAQKEDNDFGVIVRLIDGYYYPKYSGKKWDADLALLFGKKVLNCKVNELYPTAMHLTGLISEMVDRERKLLHRESTKLELAAGIEKLNVFTDLINLDFLRDAMKITVPEVLLTPYNECLVRFMIAKETNQYQEKYVELAREQNQPKQKYHG
jgi:hypothetical protein